MNILYTTNDLFAEKVAVSICSVYENNSGVDNLRIYIIGLDLTDGSKEKLKSLAQKYNREIYIIELESLKHYFDFHFDTLGWSPIILARLLMDRLLPDHVERILYLDGDTVNVRGLQSLWETDLGDKILGACIEATVDAKRKQELGMKDIPYINSGVLLVDLKRWKENECGNRIIEYYRNCGGNLFAADQDVINVVLKDDIYYLPPKYNFYNIYWFYPYRVLKKLMGTADYYDPAVYEDSLKSPVIIHYLGEERPWRKGNRHKYLEDYEKYHAKTPWKDAPQEEGWESYFTLWGIFNTLTRPVPMLRYRIINNLIPHFMKWRQKQLNSGKKV